MKCVKLGVLHPGVEPGPPVILVRTGEFLSFGAIFLL